MSYDDRRRDGFRHSGGGGGGSAAGTGSRGRGVPLSELPPELTAVSHKVIGCARDVHMALGPGYDAAVYAEALRVEMAAQGVTFVVDRPFEVRYKDRVVGRAVAPLFIGDRFVVHVMAKPGEVGTYERAQLRAVLKAGELELGLIINFAGRLLKDGLVRVLNPDKIPMLRGQGTDHHGMDAGDFEGESAGA